MKLTCLVDNAVQFGSPFWGEHGLSYLIETPEGRVLFDTGDSGTVLLHNLRAIGVEPGSIDALAISHAHYDHTGGLSALLEQVRPGIPLYASADLFRGRYSRRGETITDIGLKLSRAELAARVTLRLDTSPQEILPGIWTSGEIANRPEFQGSAPGLLMREGEALAPDAHRDDLSLVLQADDCLLLLCGCCHAGLLNTLAQVESTFGRPVTQIVGGLHLVSAGAGDLQRCAANLAARRSLGHVRPGHCTGEAALLALQGVLGPERVATAPAGTVIEIGH